MTRHNQKGDAGAAMLVLMVVLMVGWLWHDGGHTGHMSRSTSATRTDKTALEFLDEGRWNSWTRRMPAARSRAMNICVNVTI